MQKFKSVFGLLLLLGTSAVYATEFYRATPFTEKDKTEFEKLMNNGIKQSAPCATFEKKLKLKAGDFHTDSPFKSKAQAMDVMALLKEYPGLGPDIRKAFHSVALGKTEEANPAWLGKVLSKAPSCAPILALDASRALMKSSLKYAFSPQENKELRNAVLHIMKKLSVPGTTFLENSVTAKLVEEMALYPGLKITPQVVFQNKNFLRAIEDIQLSHKKKSKIKGMEGPSALGVGIVTDLTEIEPIRNKYYPLVVLPLIKG